VPIGAPAQLPQVPVLSVQNDPLGQYVFVLRSDGSGVLRAVRQQVQVRLIETDRALLEVGTGLEAGTRIAAAGAFKLYEGILVFTRERNRAGAENTNTGAANVEAQ
jgi:membrane fusion protein (multidrug efflux system)